MKEINKLIADKKWTVLEERLLSRLAFGTAGLRGPMQAGFNSMNDLVIIQTAQGITKYLLDNNSANDIQQKGIVISYDGRYNSRRFAELSAAVFLHAKIRVFLFSRMTPTPFVPFCVLKERTALGIMVTASHNPKEDNGYKVYWSNGAQIIPPHDKNIQKYILNNLEPLDSSWDVSILKTSELIKDPYSEVYDDYYPQLLKHIPPSFIEMNRKSNIEFVYTAMHGVGYPFVVEAFKQSGLPEVISVSEQQEADPAFPTVKFPNPEEGKSSLELSIKLANSRNCSLILANDPDADRLACAEKDPKTGTWRVFNGNELGALLGWWAVVCYKEQNPQADLSNCYQLASTVSSKILRAIALKEGFNFEDTLTGFKWMGNRSIELMEQGKNVLFAFEEAIGFMVGTAVLDKDGVSAAAHLGTLCCYLRDKFDISLSEKLDEIYTEYGYHCTMVSYYLCYNPKITKRIFDRIRNINGTGTYPKSVKGDEYTIKYVRDLTTGVDTSQPDGKAVLPTSKSSQMITFTFDNGVVLTLRTSGTEPKIKYYAEMCAQPGDK